ncbi:MAG TPA: ABC transporter permease [Sedimentibacter sp.]|jgi:putative ABC transport system permease protein|nr:FtsX-like permease family protein [Tissierellia bacterium]HOG62063.1 ABC transporter permease [Sedimentibacter sp.]HPB78934.1 ABC transporter permease [Sedimentibacter sp.]HPY56400.1 ABC transporter permease [Sedimentibacter sp.]HQO71791.1 ABC transporter permease [Sedimentibacter sp.]
MQARGNISNLFVRLKFSAMMALDGITSNLLRTFLTVLGISIGVAAVISLMGIGEGARRSIVAQFESLGENVIVIKSNADNVKFEIEEAEILPERVTGIEYATPVIYTEDTPVRWRRDESEMNIVGVNESYPQIKDHPVISGNFFSSLHVKQRSPVVVLGYNVAKSLLNGRSPVGYTMKIDGINYRIIGVLGEKGEGKGDGIDDKIVIPYTSAMKIAKTKDILEIWAKSNSAEDAELAMVQLGRIYKRKVGLGSNIKPSTEEGEQPPGEGGGMDMPIEEPMPEPVPEEPEEPGEKENVFEKGEEPLTITSLNNLVKEADQANRIMTVLLGGIAAVSLLVGGIGIMNIMLVAVTERTSEIGVRRALGAKKEDLLIQFLLEAVYVSIIGCVAGIVLGAWAISIVAKYGLSAVVSLDSIRIAVFVALTSGLLFGVYPAINASNLPPVEALKRQ